MNLALASDQPAPAFAVSAFAAPAPDSTPPYLFIKLMLGFTVLAPSLQEFQ